MKVFLAGATGAIGRQLVPQLLAAGHEVTGTTRSAERAKALADSGAEPVLVDALDAPAFRQAVLQARPDAVIHQLTSIPPLIDPRKIKRDFALTDRLRTEATQTLVAAAQEAGASRILAQSISFIYAHGPAGTVHAESDRLLTDEQADKEYRTVAAARALEQSVLAADGIVLRYGFFYGPGTAIAREGSLARELHRRRLPIIGGGAGVWSLIHIEDAARATLAALNHDGPAVFNIVDDSPAAVCEWIPELARAVGAPRPMRIPAWLARPLAGSYGIETMTRVQGASARLAHEQLGWRPRYRDWREGFASGL
ncbi:MAG: NAD-dependent epimerase/dehydratase family protein [Solirubrobacteraceae bacterium]